jgi:hypothetical protein
MLNTIKPVPNLYLPWKTIQGMGSNAGQELPALAEGHVIPEGVSGAARKRERVLSPRLGIYAQNCAPPASCEAAAPPGFKVDHGGPSPLSSHIHCRSVSTVIMDASSQESKDAREPLLGSPERLQQDGTGWNLVGMTTCWGTAA